MAENKKSIVVYADWIDKFEELEDDEAGRLIKHFFRYVNDLNPEAPDRTTKLMFIDIEATLKRDLVKWEKRAERSRENGSKGGRPPISENPEKPKETQQDILEPRKPDSVSVSVSVNDSVNGNVTVKEKKNIKSIEERKKEFSATLSPFLEEFGKDILNAFYFYWSEPNKAKNQKMRFELERTWSLKGRLTTWKNNEEKFNKNSNNGKSKSAVTDERQLIADQFKNILGFGKS